MQRVTRSTAAVALPAPPAGAGAPGFFTGGNSGTGAPATVPGYEWFNGVQEELMYVIEQAGLTGSANDHTKLRQAIQLMLAASAVPVGAIVAFAAANAPAGWLIANGAQLSRTTFPALWAHAQASGAIVSDATWLAGRPGAWSTGDGSTTFRIPDMRGLFLRAFHFGSGSYDDNTGTSIGQYRDSRNKSHAHSGMVLPSGSNTSSAGSGTVEEGAGAPNYALETMSLDGGVDAYPRHVSTVFCVKY